eukprot:365344-Chlamydomonas_euryale.AAC.14
MAYPCAACHAPTAQDSLPVVLPDEVQVVAAHDQGPVHLARLHHACVGTVGTAGAVGGRKDEKHLSTRRR